jgi:hypothetical protein
MSNAKPGGNVRIRRFARCRVNTNIHMALNRRVWCLTVVAAVPVTVVVADMSSAFLRSPKMVASVGALATLAITLSARGYLAALFPRGESTRRVHEMVLCFGSLLPLFVPSCCAVAARNDAVSQLQNHEPLKLTSTHLRRNGADDGIGLCKML